jgi:hypothetical protein
MRRGGSLSVALFFVTLVTAASAHADVGLHKVGDFVQPVYVTGAPGDDDTLYVVERRGTVQAVEDGAARRFLDLRDAVRGPDDAGAGTEEGLLSIAFAPDFATSRRLYAYFTEASGEANHVEELVVTPGGTADPASRRLVIALQHAEGSHHNGGQIQFGPDGLLYVAPGDGGTGGAPARQLDNFHGKLLRIDPRPSATAGYSVPQGNPFLGMPGRRGAIWAYGLRNPFRFSFDRLTGDLAIGDVGEKTFEEINFLPFAAGRGFGADLGWNACEGAFAKGSTTRPCPIAGSVMPAIEKARASGFKAIVNGYVVRDPSLPSLYGRFVYGDFFVDRLRSALLGPGGATDDREIGAGAEVHRLTSFGEDAGGCVYATSYEGGVYRLVEQDVRVPCSTAIPPPPVDKKPPVVQTVTSSAPRPLRHRKVTIRVGCDESCRVRVAAMVQIGGRLHHLGAVRRPLAAGTRKTLAFHVPATTCRAIRRALASKRRAYVRWAIVARDSNGVWAPGTIRRVRVTR